MIIKSFEEDKIKKTNLNFFLLYGENEGFKNQIIKNLLTKDFDGNIIRYDESEIVQKTEIFSTEITNKSFFDNKKVIIISRATEKANKILEDYLDKSFDDVRVIVNAGLLDKRSKLRSNFEKKKNLVCIPVYSDDNKTLNNIALLFFKRNKISISQETINLLVDRCRGNRENLNNELSKIESYSKNKKNIKIEDILKLTNLAENYSYTELCDHCLAKNQKKTLNILNENNFSSEDCIAIIRILIFKSKRLIKLKEDYILEKNFDTVFFKAKPPVFWKEKELVKRQIERWDIKAIKKFLCDLNDLELVVKKNNDNSVNILFDFILNSTKTNN